MNINVRFGYGFIISEISPEILAAFIIAHKGVLNRQPVEAQIVSIAEQKKSITHKCGIFSGYQCDNSITSGLYSVIANIISRETDLRMDICLAPGNIDGEAAIFFPELMPWEYNEKELNITETELEAIFTSYMKELCIDDMPDVMTLEYYA